MDKRVCPMLPIGYLIYRFGDGKNENMKQWIATHADALVLARRNPSRRSNTFCLRSGQCRIMLLQASGPPHQLVQLRRGREIRRRNADAAAAHRTVTRHGEDAVVLSQPARQFDVGLEAGLAAQPERGHGAAAALLFRRQDLDLPRRQQLLQLAPGLGDVDDHVDVAPARHAHDLAHRNHQAGAVADVGQQQQAGARVAAPGRPSRPGRKTHRRLAGAVRRRCQLRRLQPGFKQIARNSFKFV